MKERLTGAIILVALIVLLVPELLSGPQGPAPDGPTATSLPPGAAPTSSEEPPLRSYTINLGDDAHARTEVAGSTGPAMPQPTGPEQPARIGPSAAPNPAQPGAGPSSSGSPEQPSTPAQLAERRDGSQASSTQASSSGGQPSSGAKASGQSQALGAAQPSGSPTTSPASGATPTPGSQAHNTPAHTPTQHAAAAPVAKATAPRSEAPPKPTRTAAVAGAANTTAAPESGGWAVQLGVFQSKDNAERLALDVRAKGFKVSVAPITLGGRKLYRVRVGPTPDRSAAQELQGRLKALGRPGGAVVPYS